jgi:predicted ATPase
MKNFNLAIENFGLIEKADITLRPLTIFLGENNTGKSYVAQLIYALTRSITLYSSFISEKYSP